jgi:cell shape-determining protein MreC
LCKKYISALLVLLFSASLFAQDTGSQIVEQIDLAQAIVTKLVESLNLREASILKEKQNLVVEKTAFEIERNDWLKRQSEEKQSIEQERIDLQKEKDTFEKQKNSQEQTDQTLQNLALSLQKSENWHKVKNKALITLTVTCIVEGIIIYLK